MAKELYVLRLLKGICRTWAWGRPMEKAVERASSGMQKGYVRNRSSGVTMADTEGKARAKARRQETGG